MQTLQLAMFDKHASERARRHGTDRAAAGPRHQAIVLARAVACELAGQRPHGITADDVVEELVRRGHDVHLLGNAAGSLFRGPVWQWTGERRRSVRIHAHANELKVWRLR